MTLDEIKIEIEKIISTSQYITFNKEWFLRYCASKNCVCEFMPIDKKYDVSWNLNFAVVGFTIMFEDETSNVHLFENEEDKLLFQLSI